MTRNCETVVARRGRPSTSIALRLGLQSVLLVAVLHSGYRVEAQGPPKEAGTFRKPDLIELIKLDRTIRLDIRYATSNNFLGKPVYKQARAFLQRPAAEALVRANKALRKNGYGLLIHDGYRPWSVTKMFWDATPAEKKEFVADPSQGSRHNRGCAVDLSLFDVRTGKAVMMPSGYDEMTERSHINYTGGTDEQRRLRDMLRTAMEAEGFAVYEPEWWHYDYKDWKEYPILNIAFSEIHK
ncbi:MAG TPA: M15 family metallopeptidase [Blastocatellia bacterium]|nr:M15 family metallopeptidase [Blastocatellia bacterium]